MAIEYSGAILAPMVRVGTLPTRLLSLREGAQLVYSEEIIDHRLMNCRKFEMKKNGVYWIDFKLSEVDNPVFQTCKEEKKKVILQLGTASPERAVKAAKLVEHYVAGIDVNMGCPKDYSTKGGMGAALMKNPENAQNILRALVNNLKIPVTAKIRCFESIELTVEFAKKLEGTGISALAVHGRLKEERPRSDCRYDTIKAVAKALTIPVLANGGSNDFTCRHGIDQFQIKTGTAGVLVARAAQWNPSVFNKNGPRPIENVIVDYIKICMKYNFCYELMKYIILSIMRGQQDTDPRGLATRSALSVKQIANAWSIDWSEENKPEIDAREPDAKKRKEEIYYVYDRNHFKMKNNWPKRALEGFRKINEKVVNKPSYQHQQRKSDSRYQATLILCIETRRKEFIGGWERNKREAEQSAALQAVLELGLMTYTECNINQKDIKIEWSNVIKLWSTF